MSQRDNILDIIKGIGILLVVFAHTHIGLVNHYIYLFHMPLFFIVSGCMYAIGKGGTIKGKVKSILIPYFIFSFFSFAYWWIIESKFRPMPTIGVFGDSFCGVGVVGQQFINIFLSCNGEKAFIYNVVLWFLPCLFVTHILRNALKDNVLFIYGGVLAVLYYIIRLCGISTLPFYADIALLMVMFMIIGEKSYRWLHIRISTLAKATSFLFVSVTLFFVLAYVSNAQIGLNTGKVPHIWWLYTIPFAGYGMVYSLSWMVDKYGGHLNRPLLWLGRNSLLVMCLHEPIKRLVIKVFAVIMHSETDAIRQSLLTSMLIMIVVLFICYPSVLLIRNKMVWMIGKW